ncbi:uncharacterized protein LOC112577195 [Pomacea canaliculata]|uniref:uncharacterized protein LOC112577195 n=1 Tax=Pomacea canaliculata TaxID=400727 RepID=UPI000D729875|nr:uncharacterized protein LOC112577195 [Pomacea canaliculata]
MQPSSRGFYMAVLAGVFAALASVFAKVAASHDGAQNVVLTLSNLTKMVSTNAHFVFATEDMVVLVIILVRLFGVVGIFGSNAVQWIFFSKSLQLCSSSVVATVTSTAANFVLTAYISWMLFKEHLPLLWWCGSSLIIMGCFWFTMAAKASSALAHLQMAKKQFSETLLFILINLKHVFFFFTLRD